MRAFAELTKSDAAAIEAFLRTRPAVKHKVDGPFAPGQESTVYLMKLLPPAATRARAQPGGRPDLQRARAVTHSAAYHGDQIGSTGRTNR